MNLDSITLDTKGPSKGQGMCRPRRPPLSALLMRIAFEHIIRRSQATTNCGSRAASVSSLNDCVCREK